MKHLYKILSVVALAAVVLFAGCNKEQSSFNVSDIPGSATIIGNYHYDAGQDWDGDTYYQDIKPLANHTVYAQVYNDDLLNNGGAEVLEGAVEGSRSESGSEKGYTVYETTTDANGNFEFKVPATLDGVRVDVYPKPFLGKYSEVVGADAGEPAIETKDVVYELEKKTLNLSSNDIKLYNGLLSKSEGEEIDTYPYTSSFRVDVRENANSRSYDNEAEEYFIKYSFVPASGIDVVATIGDKKYVASTNANGSAIFYIPAKNANWSTEVDINIKAYTKTLTYWYKKEGSNTDRSEERNDFSTLEIKGCYKVNSTSTNQVSFYDLEGKPIDKIQVKMLFEPYETVDEYHSYHWSNVPFDEQEIN